MAAAVMAPAAVEEKMEVDAAAAEAQVRRQEGKRETQTKSLQSFPPPPSNASRFSWQCVLTPCPAHDARLPRWTPTRASRRCKSRSTS